MKNDTFVTAEHHSIWNNGEYDIETPCKVNLTTGEIVQIKTGGDDILEGLDHLDREYVFLKGNYKTQILATDNCVDLTVILSLL